MKKIAAILILSFLFCSASTLLAEPRQYPDRGSGYHREQPGDFGKDRGHKDKSHKSRQGDKHHKDNKNNWDKKDSRYYDRGPGHHDYRPAPPPSRHKYHKPKHKKHHHDRLPGMVRYASRHGRDARVWRVGPDTYVVKYYRGGKWYEQYLYPESGRYGGVRVTLTADPSRGWQLIPAVELNLPF